MMASLKDKIIVLTGASRGIGAVTARLPAEDGPTLILCARTAEANAETKSALEAIGAVAEAHAFDPADGTAARAVIDEVVKRHPAGQAARLGHGEILSQPVAHQIVHPGVIIVEHEMVDAGDKVEVGGLAGALEQLDGAGRRHHPILRAGD